MPTQSTNPAKFSLALRVAKDDANGPKVTRATIADALQISETQAGRVLDGTLDDDFAGINNALKSPLRAIVASVLLNGTAYSTTPNDLCGDIDADGDVDTNDVLLGTVRALREVADLVEQSRVAITSRQMTPTQQQQLVCGAGKAMATLGRTIVAANQCSITGPRLRTA